MNSGLRHKVQRSRRVALKADADILLGRLLAKHAENLTDKEILEISEMRMRLAPPTGVKAPIIHTDYTRKSVI